jgi:hypothetical protein
MLRPARWLGRLTSPRRRTRADRPTRLRQSLPQRESPPARVCYHYSAQPPIAEAGFSPARVSKNEGCTRSKRRERSGLEPRNTLKTRKLGRGGMATKKREGAKRGLNSEVGKRRRVLTAKNSEKGLGEGSEIGPDSSRVGLGRTQHYCPCFPSPLHSFRAAGFPRHGWKCGLIPTDLPSEDV